MKRFMQRILIPALALVFPKWIARLRHEVEMEEIYSRARHQIEAEAADGRLSARLFVKNID
jgi:hypothetical protein